MPEPKRVVILGATGSIGTTALRVIEEHSDRLRLVGVTAHTDYESLARICAKFGVTDAAVSDSAAYSSAKASAVFPDNINLYGDPEGLTNIATLKNADIVLVAVVGASGLRPTLAAIEAGKDISLANKELLVLGGRHVIDAAEKHGVQLLPTDSEHNAIFQCLQGQAKCDVEKLILTASGGQFRDLPTDRLVEVTPEMATKHPNWSMGPKITVDSATMANKGLELIEAHWLFGMEASKLEVVIHPESIVHSFVQMVDGSILGQLSPPSMSFAIQHCLLYPHRKSGIDSTLDFSKAFSLNFEAPDFAKYPCLRLAFEALKTGGSAPAIFNASNEIAVERFLRKEIGFTDIPKVIETALAKMEHHTNPCLQTLLQADEVSRELAGAVKF